MVANFESIYGSRILLCETSLCAEAFYHLMNHLVMKSQLSSAQRPKVACSFKYVMRMSFNKLAVLENNITANCELMVGQCPFYLWPGFQGSMRSIYLFEYHKWYRFGISNAFRRYETPIGNAANHGYGTFSEMQKHVISTDSQNSLQNLRIYVLGVGNVGRLFAHSIARLPDVSRPAVTLLLHRASDAKLFEDRGRKIKIVTNGVPSEQGGFDYEVIASSPPSLDSILESEPLPKASREVIQNLIVTTKATQTLSALSQISHRLNASSTLFFTQNGMGLCDQINSSLFSDPSTRPNYLTAVIFHGINSKEPFHSIHAGAGFVKFAPTFTSTSSMASRTSPNLTYLLNTMLQLPAVNASLVSPEELLIIQLEKLMVNCVINPLTALFRIKNGELYDLADLGPLIWSVIRETRQVILTYYAALHGVIHEKERDKFSEGALWTLVEEKSLMTGGNRSSMLQDVENGKHNETEIAFINGWVVREGKQMGVEVRLNERIVGLVEEGAQIRPEKDDIRRAFGSFALLPSA
jgi:2-dehydropantoate 2-reductase